MFESYIADHIEKVSQLSSTGDPLHKTVRVLGKTGVALFGAVGKLGLSVCVDGLHERDEGIRYAAAKKLTSIKTGLPIPKLQELLSSENRHVRRWSAYVVGTRQIRDLMEELTGLLADRDLDVARWAGWALEEMGIAFCLVTEVQRGKLGKRKVQTCSACGATLPEPRREKAAARCECGVMALYRDIT